MNIHDFETHVSKAEIKKGREDFSREKVMDLHEIAPGQWTANIFVKHVHKIQVTLTRDEITNASCPCEAFKSSVYCKHVIAVLYAIRYEKGLISDADAFVGSDPGSLGGKKATDADRRDMVAYAKQIREGFARLRDYSGHIYRDQTNQALKKPTQLLEQAETALKANDLNTAANITLAVMEAVRIGTEKLEHSSDSTQPLLDKAFEILFNICVKDTGRSLHERIYEHSLSGAEQVTTDFKYYEYRWLQLLINNKFDTAQKKKQISSLLDKLIEWTEERGLKDSHDKLRGLKMIMLKKYGQEAPIQELQSEPPPSAGNTMVSSINDPVHLATRKRFEKEMKEYLQSGNTLKYYQTRFSLLRYMQERRDHLGVRELALVYFKENPKQNYLDIIKKTYTKAEWKKVGEQYEQQLNKKS